MAARRQVTKRLRRAYAGASKKDKGKILSEVMNTTGLARSTVRRLLTGVEPPSPNERAGLRKPRRGYSDQATALLERLWALMGCPCGKYMVAMFDLWIPPLLDGGDLDGWLAGDALAQVRSMSAATIDRYLRAIKAATSLRGVSTTRTLNSALKGAIGVRMTGDDWGGLPGMIEADTVAHCGPVAAGEYARTLTMTDMATGWTENATVRNNASKWILEAVDDLRRRFPFPVTGFDSDNGSEFINHKVADWLQDQDIKQTRSRPHKKNDQATVESKNNHRVRKHAFYWRYDTATERDLLNQMWHLASIRSNVYTPTKKPVGYRSDSTGRRVRVYDQPATPWQRTKASGILTTQQIAAFETSLEGINPADLTRQINTIQNQLTELARAKTEDLANSLLLNMAPLTASINRLATTK